MRQSGILLHISSLPSAYGIGDLGPSAYQFIDDLARYGQKLWQVLPINPTDGINGHSPYSCYSAYAGNPLLISPELMLKEGFLKPVDLRHSFEFNPERIDYARVEQFKERIFNTAYSYFRQNAKNQKPFKDFCQNNAHWLDDFAIFAAAKSIYAGKTWSEWPQGMVKRQKTFLAKFSKDRTLSIERTKFVQFLFFSQWRALKIYANKQGVKIIGDIPIYVNYDSADVWCHPHNFKLNEKGQLKFVSGCPPDYFSRTGQRWGNPVYDWDRMRRMKFDWWVGRIAHNLNLYDYLRIDHFRGFVAYWQIPAHEKLAVFGRWVKAQGLKFFNVLQKKFDHLPLIAEDLGEITPDVPLLMKQFHLPGMRVCLFGLGGDIKTNPHVPANYPVDCVAYTGTHDNNTVIGYYKSEAKPNELANLPRVLGVSKVNAKSVHWDMINVLMRSKAKMVIIPLSDVLGLGAEARMNTPATKVNNWKWRMRPGAFKKEIGKRLFKITKATKRV